MRVLANSTRFADNSPESRDNSKDTNVSVINKDIDNDRVNNHNGPPH